RIADLGQRLQTANLGRHGRLGLADLASTVVEHGAYLSEIRTADEVIADAQRAVAYDHRGYGTAAAIQLRFEDGSNRRAVRICLEILHFGDQQYHFEQQVQAHLGLGRYWHHHDVAAPVFR